MRRTACAASSHSSASVAGSVSIACCTTLTFTRSRSASRWAARSRSSTMPSADLALALRGLGKDYGARVAVHAIDLDVARGECLGLLGPNGAGKTTTISMACGVTTPTRGTVTIGGVALAKEPLVAKLKLGLVPQEL